MSSAFRRRWVLAPLVASVESSAMSFRATTEMDDPALAALLTRSYVGTIDFDRDVDQVAELTTWRQIDGADDEASAVAVSGGALVGASLIAREFGTPFLYEIVVGPEYRRSGMGRALLTHSIGLLARRGEDSLSAWVTDGNRASELLLANLGFVCVTPPVQEAEALKYYRAARAMATVDTSGLQAMAASVEEVGPTLWVVRVGGAGEVTVDVRGTAVRVVTVAPDDPRVSQIAGRAIPLKGASWLLAR